MHKIKLKRLEEIMWRAAWRDSVMENIKGKFMEKRIEWGLSKYVQ